MAQSAESQSDVQNPVASENIKTGTKRKMIFQSCWNEKEHPNLGVVEFHGYEFKPCPVCGKTNKLSHRVDTHGTG